MRIIKRVIIKFSYAFRGLAFAYHEDNSFKIHLTTAALVFAAATYCKFDRLEWIIITLAIGFVLVAELFNTAIELIVKMFTDEYHEKAEKLLDISAGAVLTALLVSLILAGFLFIPHIIQ